MRVVDHARKQANDTMALAKTAASELRKRMTGMHLVTTVVAA